MLQIMILHPPYLSACVIFICIGLTSLSGCQMLVPRSRITHKILPMSLPLRKLLIDKDCHMTSLLSVGSGLVWSGLVGSGRVWSGLVWSGLVGSGLVWSGLVWSGLVWSGLVWSGRVGSGRVGSGRVGSGRVGSGRVGSGRLIQNVILIIQNRDAFI